MMTNLERVLGLVGMALIGLSAVVVDIRITARGEYRTEKKAAPVGSF